ncbi:hypothetical protein B0H14DRAFT_3875937 [Mycena olivaceomarginata]|nr:hypothetical protein B0H14DRAFT_3875937 [Mycena olivaceomarginata]
MTERLEWKLAEAERVTITVQAPQVTVQGPQDDGACAPSHCHRCAQAPEVAVLNGPPTDKFQDNLLPDVQYITTWPGAGFTNDVMSVHEPDLPRGIGRTRPDIALLHTLATFLSFPPSMYPTSTSDKSSMSPGWRRQLRIPVVEWWQVKDRNTATVDPLGCWNVWEAVAEQHKTPHFSTAPQKLHLGERIYPTTAPSWIKLYDGPQSVNDPHMRFTSLMALSFPEHRGYNLREPAKSPLLGASLPPDERLMCIDNMYWTANVEGYEFQHDHSAAWRLVGQYLHWNPRIEGLSRDYIGQALGLPAGAAIPPYIAIHVRRGDFKDWCHRPVDECFAPLSAFARRVDEVKEELARVKGIAVEHVILTSDEKDEGWWAEAVAYGWHRIDHSTTVATYGAWYPVLIDTAIQSEGHGFVGTELSTVSLIAARRVTAWQRGVVRSVKWGKVGADDHYVYSGIKLFAHYASLPSPAKSFPGGAIVVTASAAPRRPASGTRAYSTTSAVRRAAARGYATLAEPPTPKGPVSMEIKCLGLIGARGYTGQALTTLLSSHQHLELSHVSSRQLAGMLLSGYTKARVAYSNLSTADVEAMEAAGEVAWVMALPNGRQGGVSAGSVVVDLSADYRFEEGWTYGLPGCYATSAQMLIAPLVGHIALPTVFGLSGAPKVSPESLGSGVRPYALTGPIHEREGGRAGWRWSTSGWWGGRAR